MMNRSHIGDLNVQFLSVLLIRHLKNQVVGTPLFREPLGAQPTAKYWHQLDFYLPKEPELLKIFNIFNNHNYHLFSVDSNPISPKQ